MLQKRRKLTAGCDPMWRGVPRALDGQTQFVIVTGASEINTHRPDQEDGVGPLRPPYSTLSGARLSFVRRCEINAHFRARAGAMVVANIESGGHGGSSRSRGMCFEWVFISLAPVSPLRSIVLVAATEIN